MANAANDETLLMAVERPNNGRFGATMMSFRGSPTDRSGIGITRRTGKKLTVPFLLKVMFLCSKNSLKDII